MNKKRAHILFLMMAASAVIMATEIATETATDSPGNAQDSIIVSAPDTVTEEPDPEWYVAPLVRESLRAPRRAAAATCDIDSIQTYNVDSVLESVAVYEYGDTTRTMTWTVNSDGTRIGTGRTEEGTNGNTTFTATYAWDNATGTWKGTTKEEHTFTGSKEMLRTTYDWVNNAWTPLTQYTWVYDATGRETEYTTYTRNTSSNELILSQQRLREYNAVGKTTLDIQYTAHNGTTWSAGTKKEYDYDNAGNQIEYTYYSSLSNGNWVRSTHEIWTYTSGKKTLYEKYTWSNGNWVGSTKEIWTFNASGKQILHEKFGWSNGDWAISLQENAGYDNAGNNTLVENYTITSGTWKGSKKEEYTYNSANKKTGTITYKWSNSAWVKNVWTVTDYDAAGNTIESCKYNWKNEAWVGTGTRTLQTYNSNKKVTEKITQSWSTALNDWLNKTRNTTQYSGSKTTQEASYKWSADANDWVGTSRSDWHYNAAGLNDTIKTYTPDGTGWLYSGRTVNTYNAEGTNIMTHNAKWQDNAWVLVSMARVDIIKDAEGHQLLNASWHCYADSVWIGVQKDTAAYNAHGKAIYTARYTSWANNDWVPSYKQRFEYDEADRILLNERYNWSSNKWQGAFRYEYGYDEQGRQNYSATYNSYNSSTDSWVGTTMTMTVFNELGQTVMSTLHNWQNSDWNAFNKYLYTYDTEGHLVEQVVQSYSNNEWQNALRYEKGYHNGVLVVSNDYTWRDNAWHLTSKSEKTYDEDAQAKLRREITGRWNSSTGASISYTDNLYFYDCDPKYTIRFVNDDNTPLLPDQVLLEGRMPSVPANPTKAATAQYTYTFAGWDQEVAAATANATYTATYNQTVNKYTIKWVNEDGAVLKSETLDYGTMPTAPVDPTKDATVQYTYAFAGWDRTIAIVTGEATYNATFNSTVNKYTIKWVNEEGTELKSETLDYGAMPTAPANPTKAATAQYTYTFKSWNNEIASVIGEATYTAIFDSTVNKYLITFKNDETTLQSTEVAYGVTPEYIGTTPIKQGDAQYTYTFKGWDIPIATVTKDTTYTATFSSTVNKYLVTFKNEDGTELKSTEVEYGATPTAPADPTKDATAQYSYAFAGWDKEITAVTGEAIYTATYTETQKGYTITWRSDDGSLIEETIVEFGTAPAHANINKESTDQYTFTFKGWSPVLAPVSGDATYTAVFDTIVNTYTVTFYFEDGITVLDQVTVAYGETPGTHLTPSEPMEEHYYYTFAGWSPEIVPVTGEASYTAVFKRVPKDYTITFRNYDKTLLQTAVFPYGGTPVYSGEEPARKPNAQYTYTFAGWSPEIAAVTGDATYTARFDAELNSYTITWLNEDGTELDRQTVEYGAIPVYDGETPVKEADDQYIYTFKGWTPAVVRVTRDATYRATYTSQDKSQALEDVQGNNVQCTKILRGDQIYILRGNKIYTMQGVEIEE